MTDIRIDLGGLGPRNARRGPRRHGSSAAAGEGAPATGFNRRLDGGSPMPRRVPPGADRTGNGDAKRWQEPRRRHLHRYGREGCRVTLISVGLTAIGAVKGSRAALRRAAAPGQDAGGPAKPRDGGIAVPPRLLRPQGRPAPRLGLAGLWRRRRCRLHAGQGRRRLATRRGDAQRLPGVPMIRCWRPHCRMAAGLPSS